MAVYSRQMLSGSTNGRPIPVVATTTPGTTIHTAVSGSSSIDEVYLWAANITTADVNLTVEFGGVADPGDHLVKAYTIPAKSPAIPIATGFPLQGGVLVKAFCSTASAINVVGFVNRIVP